CTGCERFVPDNEVQEGTCPLHPNQALKRLKEENYFFKLSAYQEPLLEWYRQHPNFIQPEARRNETIRYVQDHLEDISISRAASQLSSGIPVPGDASQRIYVWFDALINYITVAGFGTDDEQTKRIWPADVHLVGKDIIKFHCALWPAMILSVAKSDPLLKQMAMDHHVLPKTVFAHGFFTIEGTKISKSLGNAIDPRDLIPTYGLDAIRYFLMKEIAFGEDGDFSINRLNERYDTDLANTLGNLVQRSVSMCRRYFSNNTPEVDLIKAGASPNMSIWDGAAGLDTLRKTYEAHMRDLRVDKALDTIWGTGQLRGSGIIHANKFVEETKPFKLVKQDAMKVGEILYALLEACRQYAWLLEPIMPHVAKQIIETLGQDYTTESATSLNERLTWGGLDMKAPLPEPKPIFPRRASTEDT
ncbi:class I tRNA ligase family protein, partial [Candidatus Uhrbacteria bacterium]|nr:class I tRNA ligase family protein [Candidatus Uhrbacteria bacterium]MBD3284524.1 class I tRNA ligase family protein [Candidatus Uhrbacteria bacterium]